MRPECYFCHIKTAQNLLAKFNPLLNVAEDFIFSVHEILGDNRSMINPKLATDIHRIAKQKLNAKDLYAIEKLSSNKLLLTEYGVHSVNGDIKEQIKSLLNTPFAIDKSKELKKTIQQAKSILCLGDNAGEVFFDRLLLETIHHPNVTFATSGASVINNITLDDAKQIGIDKICKVIHNGFDAPSTLIVFCSDQFLQAYSNADLLFSKGQGNFEDLMKEKHPKTFFLLMAKCEPMAEMLRCAENDLIVTQLN